MPAQRKEQLRFPQGFLWGTATSSHQVEGGNDNNNWWAWEQYPDAIADGSHSGLACDWWHRAEEDLRLAAHLGQNTHRLSLEWSRIEPQSGRWDESAIGRYRQLLLAMRSLDMVPMVTLHHFTLPLWLYERGGWEGEDAVDHFCRYVAYVVEALGDLVPLWCTINEPMVYATYGHLLGLWPPGCGGPRAAYRVLRNMVRAHVKAYEIIHRRWPQARVGYAKHIHLFDAAHPGCWIDGAAAKAVDYFFNETPLMAFWHGRMPSLLHRSSREKGGAWLDFLGLNYYSRSMVAFDPRHGEEFFIRRFPNPASDFSMEGWGEIYPHGLYRALKRLSAYGLPLYVTEFGVPDNDDTLRPRFIVEHVAALHRALKEGIPVRGAYFWSLVDNFEWHEGWRARFGLVHLDPGTQERRPRRSAYVYQRIANENALDQGLVSDLAPDLAPSLFDGQQ